METIAITMEKLKANLLHMVPSTYSLTSNSFEMDEDPMDGETSICIRYLGEWKDNPYEQDCDQLHLEEESIADINRAVDKTINETGRNITWSQEEKCWLYFNIKN